MTLWKCVIYWIIYNYLRRWIAESVCADTAGRAAVHPCSEIADAQRRRTMAKYNEHNNISSVIILYRPITMKTYNYFFKSYWCTYPLYINVCTNWTSVGYCVYVFLVTVKLLLYLMADVNLIFIFLTFADDFLAYHFTAYIMPRSAVIHIFFRVRSKWTITRPYNWVTKNISNDEIRRIARGSNHVLDRRR